MCVLHVPGALSGHPSLCEVYDIGQHVYVCAVTVFVCVVLGGSSQGWLNRSLCITMLCSVLLAIGRMDYFMIHIHTNSKRYIILGLPIVRFFSEILHKLQSLDGSITSRQTTRLCSPKAKKTFGCFVCVNNSDCTDAHTRTYTHRCTLPPIIYKCCSVSVVCDRV